MRESTHAAQKDSAKERTARTGTGDRKVKTAKTIRKDKARAKTNQEKTLQRSKKMGTKVRSTQTILFYILSFIGCSLWAFVVDIATTAQ